MAQPQSGLDGGDGLGIDEVNASCARLIAAQVGSGFADAFEQTPKIGGFHE